MTGIVSVKVDGSELARIDKALFETANGKALRAAFRKSLRQTTDKVIAAEQAAVRSLHSAGTTRRGQREAHFENAYGKRKKMSAKKRQQAMAAAGLRDSTALAIKRVIRYQGKDIGIRVRVSGSKMPQGLARLPKKMNKGKWSHPVFGNRDVWVEQTVDRKGWFDDTNRQMFPQIKADAEATIQKYAQDLAQQLSQQLKG